MTFEEALRIFDLDSLVNQTDKSLTKRFRMLAKERHPDSGKETEYTFIETQSAFDLLRVNLSKGNLEVAPGIRLKPCKKVLLRQYIDVLAENKMNLSSLMDKTQFKLDLFLSLVLTDLNESQIFITQTKRIVREASLENVYTIRIMLNFNSNQRLRVILLDGFETYIDLYNSFTCVRVPIAVPDTFMKLKFDIMVIKSNTEGVVIA